MSTRSARAILLFVSLLLIGMSFLPMVLKNTNVAQTGAGQFSEKLVIVDAGHGGFDGGAVAPDGTVEKDINLQIATSLSELLALNGYSVIMTRSTDTGTEDDLTKPIQVRKVSDLKNRLALMEKYPQAIFVSIHLNKFTASSAKGAQVFYSKNNPESFTLGDSIQGNIKKLLQPANERVIKQGTKSTYLLYNARIPAVIVECGFLSNAEDLKKLKTDKYKNQIAFATFCGINDYFVER